MNNTSHGPHRAPKNRTSQPPFNPNMNGAFKNLIPELQRAVSAAGYSTPTPIQEECIPHLISGRDLLGSAQTGTGKTAAFALPLMQQLAQAKRHPRKGEPRALILAPTRELAGQVGASIKTYGRFLNLTHTVIFGGVKQGNQVRDLNRGVDIVVATPGRLLDLMEQGHLRLSGIEVFILDEVDRMLDMGFIPDIKRIIAKVPEQRQNLFFSATLPKQVADLAHSMVSNPVMVTLSHSQPMVEKINQNVLFVAKHDKHKLLLEILSNTGVEKALVFTQMKSSANRLVDKLQANGIRGTAIHGNKTQAARTKALDGFKRGRVQVLVATDVAARGLDVDDISHVINYDLPVEAETYIHRIGRTGRAGAEGNAVSLCSAEDRAYLHDIERLIGQAVPATMDNPYHSEAASRSRAPKKTYARGQTRKRRRNPKKSLRR